MANENFNAYGVTLHTSDGDYVLNAGANMTIFPQGNLITFAVQLPAGMVINNLNAWQPPTIQDANSLNNSVYFSSDASKLVYKDISGVVHSLY